MAPLIFYTLDNVVTITGHFFQVWQHEQSK
jgi:hypothetical protein